MVLGNDSLNIAAELVRRSELHVIVLQPDADQADRWRRRLDAADRNGSRVSVLASTLADSDLPPYFAGRIIVADDAERSIAWDAGSLAAILRCLRPYGGTAHFFDVVPEQASVLAELAEQAEFEGFEARIGDDLVQSVRRRKLPGATNYSEPFQPSLDDRVRAPLGVLWYNDLAGFFKRSPPPMFVDGVMRVYDKLWLGYPDGDRPPYKLDEPVYQDIYTGRILTDDEIPAADARFPAFDASDKQPSQYRPPTQRDAWNPPQPEIGQRIDPLTGQAQPRKFPKSYGCDGGFDYGWLYTMRSGTAAFYDKRLESGTIHISGPRSGCTNSIVPAGGLLNVPYYFTGCTCSYPLPSSLSLVSLPATHEQWSTWGRDSDQPVTGIRRLGINLGAPGARMTPEGTLWLDYPNVGGPAPLVSIRTEPAEPPWFYRHSVFLQGGNGWPWVAASGAEGLSSLTVDGIRPGIYTVRLTFVEIEKHAPSERVFDVRLQDQVVLERLDIAQVAGGAMRAVTHQVDRIQLQDSLDLHMVARQGMPLLSGIELFEASQP